MMRNYRVPVGMSPEEIEKATEFFDKKQNQKRWYQRKKKINHMYSDNNNSKAIYLMGPDNKFLQFYNLDIEMNELAEQITEEISYDIGIRHIGTGGRPMTRL